jgi:carbon monoxide dehydrogenase subunit G
MTTITNTAHIQRKPEEVFDYLVDMRNELEWNPSAQSMEKITDGPLGIGTRFRAKWKQSQLIDVECTAFDRPNGWTYLNGGPVAVTFTARLTPTDGGTRLDSSFDATPRGWFRLVFPIFVRVMKREERANMARLKEALERRP